MTITEEFYLKLIYPEESAVLLKKMMSDFGTEMKDSRTS